GELKRIKELGLPGIKLHPDYQGVMIDDVRYMNIIEYADAMDLDNLPDPDYYLLMKRIKQLYIEFYKEKNIEKFRNAKLSIERKAVA
ncbi:MAG: hypothetical protein II273_03090, partial [Lachnospiraceae bacterium]|nr:hypothetical protein [Lachnospiraceae bacterium]